MVDKIDNENQLNGATNLFDLSSYVLDDETPFCPTTGQACSRKARTNMWVCEASNYTIPINHWEIIMMHAGVAQRVLHELGVESIVYNGTPIELQFAVAPSHLLPLLAYRCIEICAASNITDTFMLSLVNIGEEAESSGATLMPEMVTLQHPQGNLAESLQIIVSAIHDSVRRATADNESIDALDYRYFLSEEELASIAANSGW